MNGKKNTLYIVGAGPGTEARLTAEARRIVAGCGFVAGGGRFLALAPAAAETHAIGADLNEARSFIAAGLEHGDVCVLVSGDPGCYSILPFLSREFGDRIQVEPGISSVQLLAAQLRLTWQGWAIISLHGRAQDPAPLPSRSSATVYLCDIDSTPQAIAADLPRLLAASRAAVGTNLGLGDEQLWQGTLGEVALREFPGNSLLLVWPAGYGQKEAIRDVAAGKPDLDREAFADFPGAMPAPVPGIPDEMWLRRPGIPLSKSEVRAVLLSKARPRGRRIIWDSGAGTGSYGIECALMEPRARVYSIDKNSEACQTTEENASHFGAVIETIQGEAPDCFAGLPQPDLVIIGGNDGRLDTIFQGALAALAPGGRIVVTALLEETKIKAHALFAASGLVERSATKVVISRGAAQKWAEHNPVIIFTGDKPAERT